MRYGTPEACRSFFVVFGRELDGPSREERSQFLGGLFGAELFGDMRLAQPRHHRCDAGGALKLLNRRDAGDLCLPVAKTELFDHVQAFDGFIALEHELNERERRGSGFPRSIPG
jgi:hypothetical protein